MAQYIISSDYFGSSGRITAAGFAVMASLIRSMFGRKDVRIIRHNGEPVGIVLDRPLTDNQWEKLMTLMSKDNDLVNLV